MTNRKADAYITLEIDVLDGKTLVVGYLRPRCDPDRQVRSFSTALSDAGLLDRLPVMLADLRAEAALGRCETQAESAMRRQSACTELTVQGVCNA